MKLSIVIPVYDPTDIKFLETCVDSIRRNSKEPHEIIIIINPVVSDVEATMKYKDIKANQIVVTDKQGQCHANNLGVNQATNDFIMIVDYDTVFPEDWEKGLQHIKDNTVLCFNCIENNTRGVAPGFHFVECGGINNFDLEKFEKASKELSREEIVPGFCYPFIIKKEHYLAISGFDEGYDPWGSWCDSDFEYKCMLYGLDPERYFGVNVYHFSQTSPTFADTNEMDYFRKGNTRYFENKWQFGRARSPQIWWAEFFIPRTTGFKPEWMNKISDKYMGNDEDNVGWECPQCRFVNIQTRINCRKCNYEKVQNSNGG